MEHATQIGARIREYRLRRGLTAAALAKQVGITENAVRKIESGDSKEPRFSTGVRIAAALDVDPLVLVGRSDKPGPVLGEVVQTIRASRAELTAIGVRHVSVFGSVARGKTDASSDVDVIIEPEPDAKFTLFDLVHSQRLLEKALGMPVDVVTPASLENSEFGRNAREDAVRAF